MPKIRVLIVDDSAIVRQTLKDLLTAEGDFEVMGVAQDPVFALRLMESGDPDVIISDLEMPRMDGLAFLRQLAETKPRIPVVVCSSKAETGSENAITALELGAIEIIQKPKLGTKVFLEESRVALCDVVKAAYLARNKPRPTGAFPVHKAQPKLNADAMLPRPTGSQNIETTEKIALIGASTGGTEALRIFLEALPDDAPGMVIVQHMPEKFTADFARRLDSLCRVAVKEAEHNDTVLRGRVLIAPGNKHTLLKRSGARYYVEVKDGPLVSRHRPSVDVLFRSGARHAGANAVGVIMTGMGDDGAAGMKEMHDAGAWNIAQDEASCVVFGMPKEAIRAGGVDQVLPLERIVPGLLARTR